MNIVHLRFEAQQCYLRATRSTDEAEIARLRTLGDRLAALADHAELSVCRTTERTSGAVTNSRRDAGF